MKKLMMTMLLLGLMLGLTATVAMAEWSRVDSINDSILYVDTATIRRNGNLVKMWELIDYKTVQKAADVSPFLSMKSQQEYDCKEERTRMLAFTTFDRKMGSGKVVFSDGNARGEWAPVQPESIGELMWKIACGKK